MRVWLAVALVWGLAEATAFFVVPDVLLTAAMLRFGWRRALGLAAVAALGATLGGYLMWRWAGQYPEEARAFLVTVPLLGEDLLIRVRAELAGFWPLHLVKGAVTGAPYKIYAVEAGASSINPLAFSLVSAAARFARFALTMGFVSFAHIVLLRSGIFRRARGVSGPVFVAAFWVCIYVGYVAVRIIATL